ncbi:GNAT family N-acetyltransferase [Paenibacillus radicis (ex Gao et al. 2016)]|uniref:N-acetyltransferase domain-containing protein n=1 Tax=Paenibacillus radicis (ex Gao et al. 2016) TaxID=1737354 RepID=A0A917HF73_9BACL|nr:GNAT family N-acetyltransferase [Paenibacillus radicis (ex Gao et al. 2016)]GGG76845.1 hypothetical protein GCM10010918_36760 [Paenibacillus radicis (ex Gao et al. 2016)]
MNLFPSVWRTFAYKIADLEPHEIDAVQQIYNSCTAISEWDGRTYNPLYVRESYEAGILPEGGVKEQFKIQTIRNESMNEIIGFLSLYHGYPRDSSIYLAFMGIAGDHQKQGYGKQVVKQLLIEARRLGYSEVRVNVSLKNWPALRFWTHSGFNHISGIFGDKKISDEHFADVELVNELA